MIPPLIPPLLTGALVRRVRGDRNVELVFTNEIILL
jgi:hypothetical protein